MGVGGHGHPLCSSVPYRPSTTKIKLGLIHSSELGVRDLAHSEAMEETVASATGGWIIADKDGSSGVPPAVTCAGGQGGFPGEWLEYQLPLRPATEPSVLEGGCRGIPSTRALIRAKAQAHVNGIV